MTGTIKHTIEVPSSSYRLKASLDIISHKHLRRPAEQEVVELQIHDSAHTAYIWLSPQEIEELITVLQYVVHETKEGR